MTKKKPLQDYTEWRDEIIETPMNEGDFIEKANELLAIHKDLGEALIEKKKITDKVKEIEQSRDFIVSKIARQVKEQTCPCQWLFNWDTGKKKKIAQLPDRTVIDVCEVDITDADRQLTLPTEAEPEPAF